MHGPRFDLPLEAQEVESHQHVRRLMLFFAVVYAGEGIGQTGRLIAQPLIPSLRKYMAGRRYKFPLTLQLSTSPGS